MPTSSVCLVLFLRLLIWKPDWDRPAVTLIQFSSTAGYVGFVRDLVKAGSVDFVLNTLGSFSLPRRLVLRGSLLMRVQATGILVNPPSGPLLTGEGLCHLEIQGAAGDAQNWFVGSADVKCASPGGDRRFSHCPLSAHPKLVTWE